MGYKIQKPEKMEILNFLKICEKKNMYFLNAEKFKRDFFLAPTISLLTYVLYIIMVWVGDL